MLVAETKELIKKLLEISGMKLCLSQIIPLKAIAQVKSVIRQVNRNFSSFITDSGKSPGYDRRIFSENNDALGRFIYKDTKSHGYVVGLNTEGEGNCGYI